jgi:hypothetical protein
VAFRAPKQEPETKRARMREPMGPKTWEPKATATVLVESMMERGRTKKYEMLARR